MKKSHTFLTRVGRMMRNMKDSGIEWIDKIPKEWEIIRVKDKYYFNTGFTPDTKNPEYYNDEDGYEWVTISDINNGKINSPTISLISRDYVKNNFCKQVPKGCLLYSFKLSIGQTAITDRPLFTNEALASFIPSPNTNIRFLNYSSSLIEFNANTNIYGAKILNQQLINNAYIVFPPLNEQKQIADFLDHKCSEIDALRLEIEKEIATLKEYKKSIITEAVTKGLNKNVPMKDSNIKWIDSIPNLWQVIRLKYAYWLKGRIGWQGLRADEFVENENCPYLITGTDFDEGHIDWSGCVHITEERFSQDSFIHVKENDLLITKDGTIGKVAIAKKCPEKVSLNTGVLIMRNTRNYKCINKYIYYIISSNQFFDWYKLNHSGNSTIKHLNQEKFYNFQFTLPRYTEQKQIADYLDRKCSKINDIIKAKNKQLSTLDEYKKSLIYEYVTGKKEVPSV